MSYFETSNYRRFIIPKKFEIKYKDIIDLKTAMTVETDCTKAFRCKLSKSDHCNLDDMPWLHFIVFYDTGRVRLNVIASRAKSEILSCQEVVPGSVFSLTYPETRLKSLQIDFSTFKKLNGGIEISILRVFTPKK